MKLQVSDGNKCYLCIYVCLYLASIRGYGIAIGSFVTSCSWGGGGMSSLTPTKRGNVKSIFHCNAKPFALGPRVGLDRQCQNSALGI